jgi:hypothetical protein
MKVFNLRCSLGHSFEGWFASEADHAHQLENGLLACPMCGDVNVLRLPSAPRLNLSGAPRHEAPDAPAGAAADASQQAETRLQARWLQAVQQVLAHTEDVGERFPEEARRIHHGEVEARGIRGQASPAERAALQEEGIEVHSLPLPKALIGPRH